MLLKDGVKYEEWVPQGPRAEDELEQMVKEHAQDIFGEDSIYLDKKQKLKSLAGVGSIPDGLVITFGNVPEWHIVEVELSSHDPYGHIVPQVDRFLNGADNRDTRNKIIEALYDAICGDEFLKLQTLQAIGPGKDIHKFLFDLIASPPNITIIIEEYTNQLREALKKYPQKKVVEFQTFTREGVGLAVHAHIFKPLCPPKVIIVSGGGEAMSVPPPPIVQTGHVEIHLSKIYAARRWVHIPISGRQRGFFPGFKVYFELETDVGVIATRISSGKAETPIGDPMEGKRIQGGLRLWYDKHPELKDGATLMIKELEPKKKYGLEILKTQN